MPEQSVTDRARHVLGRMHKAFSHDLPNQMVALQSLLHLLEVGEAGRLSPDGQECVARLHNVARKAAAMVRFLKEMGRLASYQGVIDEVVLDALGRRVKV